MLSTSEIGAIPSARRPRAPPVTSRQADWLGRALDAANVLSTAAQFAPIPWIGPAASIVVKFLEMVQVCYTSRSYMLLAM